MGRAFEFRKEAKFKRWGKMSRVFPKLGKAITIAAKQGGGDPDMNAKLRTAIANAKAENMPKDNIDRAIKKALGKDAASFTEIVYEGKGPHGVQIVVECATDNNTRTVANVKSYFNKAGGQILTSGSLDFMFEKKSVFIFPAPEGKNLEELELELIDAGLEELEEYEGEITVLGGWDDFGALDAALHSMGIEVTKAVRQRFATQPQAFSPEQMVDIEKLLDKLDEDEDVQEVFTNIA
ncbi:MAG: YebC/PmpR family DNA-binding transcriptional regulator [Deltaproteobacteria bacterium]|nr:YebC/PmpR family DNA-binding transcriptional regulator [Deltaproteobacteria bacterium]